MIPKLRAVEAVERLPRERQDELADAILEAADTREDRRSIAAGEASFVEHCETYAPVLDQPAAEDRVRAGPGGASGKQRQERESPDVSPSPPARRSSDR